MSTYSSCIIACEDYTPVLPLFTDCTSCKLSYQSKNPLKPCPDPFDTCSPCPYHGVRNIINHYRAKERSIENPHSALSIKCVFSPGEVYYQLDGLKYTLTRKNYLIFNEGQRYHTSIDSVTEVHGFCVMFGLAFSREILRTLIEPLDTLLEEPYSSCNQPVLFFERMYNHDRFITPLLRSLRKSMDGPVTCEWFEETLHLLLEKLLIVHRQLYSKIDELQGVKEKTRIEIFRRLSRAKDYIESCYAEPLDLAAIARMAHLSKHHFLRLFSQAFGTTPYQYLVQIRLGKARELIESGKDNITNICLNAGFRDVSSFYRLFKKRYGVMPGKLRPGGAQCLPEEIMSGGASDHSCHQGESRFPGPRRGSDGMTPAFTRPVLPLMAHLQGEALMSSPPGDSFGNPGFWAALAAAGAFLPLPGQVEKVPLIPRSVLFGNPEKVDPALSPDGRMLAYLAPHEGVLNIWIRVPGSDRDMVVTSNRAGGIHAFSWQQDSAHVLYLQDRDGDENFHLCQTGVKSGTTRDLTPFPGVKVSLNALNPEHPDRALVEMNMRDRRFFDVYRVDLKTGDLQLDTENPGDVNGWYADYGMQIRACRAALPGGEMEIRARKDPASPWSVLQRWAPEDCEGSIAAFTPDTMGIYLLSCVDANAIRLMECDLLTGAMVERAADTDYDISEVLIHPETHHLLAVRFTRARGEWHILDQSIEADFQALGKVDRGDLDVVSYTRDFGKWIVQFTSNDRPPQYYEYTRATRKASFLFSTRLIPEHFTLAGKEPVSFESRDGLTLHGYLTLPPGGSRRNHSLVMFVHGGPARRDNWGFGCVAQWLANRGYAVLQVNFRGSAGYGKAFLNAGDREWGRKMLYDILDGKEWAVRQGYADPQRVAIYGASYGGYAALAGLAFTPDEFACGVDIVGISNLITFLRSIPPYWAHVRALLDRRVGSLSDEEFLKSRSPFFSAPHIKAPLLIAQGANDPRVKRQESDQIAEVIRKNGRDVEYLVFPDEGHGFVRPENRRKFYAAAEVFLARHLGGRCEPPSEGEEWDELKR